jgi:peptidoglycan/LPS O-acetylase OafA/YrhL
VGNRPNHYIPTLDGWRTIAIVAVLLCHGLSLTDDGLARQPLAGHVVLSLGQQGVSLFFAISGYLITTLMLDEYSSNGRVSLRSFYIRRAFRILPPAYTYLGVIAALGAAGWLALARGEVLSALFIYNNYWPHRSWYTQHFWSLSMEEHFYLFWPPALAFLGWPRARWLALLLIIATIVWRPWSLRHFHLAVGDLQRTDMRLDAFLFACLAAILLHGKPGRPLVRVVSSPWFHITVIGLLAIVYSVALRHPELQSTRVLVQSALLPLIIVPTVFRPQYWVSRVLETWPMQRIGRISYSLYLWQQLVLHEDAPDFLSALASFPLRVAVVFALAYVSYRVVELPSMAAGRRLALRFSVPRISRGEGGTKNSGADARAQTGA